jgi:hypothetical protein
MADLNQGPIIRATDTNGYQTGGYTINPNYSGAPVAAINTQTGASLPNSTYANGQSKTHSDGSAFALQPSDPLQGGGVNPDTGAVSGVGSRQTPNAANGYTSPPVPQAPIPQAPVTTSASSPSGSTSAPQGDVSGAGTTTSAGGGYSRYTAGMTDAEKQMQDYLDNPIAPKSEAQILSEKTSQAQDQVNNINNVFNSQLLDQSRANDQRSAETNAQSVLNGLTGSTEAGQHAFQTTALNNQDNAKIQNQKALALSTLFQQIKNDAATEARQQAQDYRTNATSALASISARRDKNTAKAKENIVTLASSGATLDGIKKANLATYQHLADSVGGEDMLKAMFILNIPKDKIHDTKVENGMYIVSYENPLTGKISVQTLDLGLPKGAVQVADAGGYILFGQAGADGKWDGNMKTTTRIDKTLSPDQAADNYRADQKDTAANASVDPNTLEGMLNVYRSTGATPAFGLGKSPLRAQFYAALGGADGQQVVNDAQTNKAARAGVTTALRTQTNQYAANQTSIATLDKQLDLAKSYSDKVSRVDSPIIAKYQLAIKNGVFGDPDTAALHNIVTTASYELAKILSGSSASIAGATVSSQQDAENMLNSAMSTGQFNEVLGLMKKEADFRLKSQADTIANLKKDSQNIGTIVKEAAGGQTVKSNGQDYIVGQVYNDGTANWTVDASGKWTKQ